MNSLIRISRRFVPYFFFILVLLSVIFNTGVQAQDTSSMLSHEDPDAAGKTFSSISLLRYYSSSLDIIIQKDEKSSTAHLEKMPYTNIPDDLATITERFAGNGIDFTQSLVDLYAMWNKENELISQYRLPEAAEIYNRLTDGIVQARRELNALESSVVATGDYLEVEHEPAQGELKQTYDEILTKIRQLHGMLDLLSRPMFPASLAGDLGSRDNPGSNDTFSDLTPEQLMQLFLPTELTLEISPLTAFVGDVVSFNGRLSSAGSPLAGRNISLYLDGMELMRIVTDDIGQFGGTFRIPFNYIHEAEVQVIYYPETSDAGRYLAAVSPAVTLTVLFYEATLELSQEGPAYPGREAAIAGVLNYGRAPSLTSRNIKLYLDDNLITGFEAGPQFSQAVSLNPDIAPGTHTVTVLLPESGRYAPVTGTCLLKVMLATPVLEIDIPAVSFMPGELAITGRIYSEVGPLQAADVNIAVAGTNVMLQTGQDGTFQAKLKRGPELSLLGNQVASIDIQPAEPWNAPVSTNESTFSINIITCGLGIVILFASGVFIPGRIKKRDVLNKGKAGLKKEFVAAPVRSSLPANRAGLPLEETNIDEKEIAANPIAHWYRLALKIVQKLTAVVPGPQQTLREYAGQTAGALGPVGKYFIELTRLIEKKLYSRWQPTKTDIDKTRQLALSILEETKKP